MNNFIYQNPTKIIFGKGQISRLSKEIPQSAKVLMLYGGGSIKTNGIYSQVTEALKEHQLVEFSGITANPEYEVLMKAVCLIKEQKIDYLLAVGGGSVIDGTKFTAAAVKYDGDAWEMLKNRVKITEALPFASVLTLPATASEMNSGFVISREETQEKLAMGSPLLYPKFSVLDPEVIKSIPEHQIVNGIVDAFNHVLEQYMTYPVGADLQDRFSESILATLINEAPHVIKDKTNYKVCANYMWSCTMALNGLIEQGVPSDWAIHMMGHELTALFGIDHARTLAIVGMNHYRHFFEAKKQKLAQFAERVYHMNTGSVEERADLAIENIEAFYHQLGVKTKLSDYTKDYEKSAEIISDRFVKRGWLGLGENQMVKPEDVKKIIEKSF